MLARARRQYVSPAVRALAAVAAGREDDAFRHSQEAFEIRDPECQLFFSPHLGSLSAPLYKSPRFRELLAQNGRSDWLGV
jgi:hypothetical protein